jgi:hypothetical protein
LWCRSKGNMGMNRIATTFTAFGIVLGLVGCSDTSGPSVSESTSPSSRMVAGPGAWVTSPSNSSDQTGQAILPYGNDCVHASPLLAGPRFRPYLSGVRGGSAWGLVGHSPRRSRRAQDQRADQPAKQRRIRTIGGKRQLDPGRRLLDPHRDLQQPQTDGGEFAIG